MQTLTQKPTPESISRAAPAAAPRPIRVCFVIDDLAAAGTESQLLALIGRLDRNRVLPYLCLLRGGGPVSRSLEPNDCPVLRLGVGALLRPYAALQAIRFIHFLRRERIDVVQTYFADSSYFGVPAAWLAGAPHRLRTRNNLGHWLTPLHRRLGRLLNAAATGTVVNCAAARAALLADEGPPPETITVLENGVDHARFLAVPPLPPEPPAARRVGAVANLRPVKGLDVFLEAAAWLAREHPDLTFSVAGEGAMRGPLTASARTRTDGLLSPARRGRGRAEIPGRPGYRRFALAFGGYVERAPGVHGGGAADRGHGRRRRAGADRGRRSRPPRAARRRRPAGRGDQPTALAAAAGPPSRGGRPPPRPRPVRPRGHGRAFHRVLRAFKPFSPESIPLTRSGGPWRCPP